MWLSRLGISGRGQNHRAGARVDERVTLPERTNLGNFPTRLVRLPDLGAELGIDLWIKHEFEADSFGAGNKVRKLEFLIPEIIREGCSGLVVDGTTQSNCAMALALYAPRFGLTVDLVLNGPAERGGNYIDILRSGATVTPLPEWSPQAVREAQDRIVDQAAQRGQRLYVVPTGATNETTAFAGVDLAQELADQESKLGISFETVVFPTASGGTQAGLEIAKLIHNWPWSLTGIGVANNPQFFRNEVEKIANGPLFKPLTNGKAERLKVHTYMGALGQGYGIPLPDTFESIKELRTRFGLVLDSVYTYKAFVGLRQLISQGSIRTGSSVMFIHTGGVNERFLDFS